jgi:GMP synthase (glutamine-hydrolysing)
MNIHAIQHLPFQFHLEMTPTGVQQLITHCGREIVSGPYIDKPQKMIVDNNRFVLINAVLWQILDRIEQSTLSIT